MNEHRGRYQLDNYNEKCHLAIVEHLNIGENNAQGLADCSSDGEDSDVQLDMPVAEETETEGFWHWMALQEMDVNRFRVKTEEHRLCQSMRCKDWRPC